MSRLSRAEAEAQLRHPDGSLLVVLKQLPDDVDPELAARAILPLLDSHGVWKFAQNCRALPTPVIRALLREISEARVRSAHAIFLLEALRDEADLAGAWRSALKASQDLTSSYSWGSKQLRAKLKALASEPKLLAAIQAAVVGGSDATLPMLAVLAADGSETSADALLPHFVIGSDGRFRLDELERLQTHAARTPAMAAMLAEIHRRVQEHGATSPALAFGRARGISTKKLIVFVRLQGTRSSIWRTITSHQCEITIDSTASRWMKVEVTCLPEKSASTSFTDAATLRDDLSLSGCAPSDLPVWLAEAQRKLGVTWGEPEFISTLGDARRREFIDCLLGPSRR